MKLDITTREDYIIAAALTGPGIEALTPLKRFITGEIRRACGVPDGPSGGPVVRNKPTDIKAVRRRVHWLYARVKEHPFLRQAVIHWVTHAHNALVELGETDGWLLWFVRLLGEMVYNPYRNGTLERIDEHLDKFTEENSRIGDKNETRR